MIIAEEWFTVEEAAEYLCVSRRTIYKLTREGKLPAFRIGRERHRRFRFIVNLWYVNLRRRGLSFYATPQTGYMLADKVALPNRLDC